MLQDSEFPFLIEAVSCDLVGKDALHNLTIKVLHRSVVCVEGDLVRGHLDNVFVGYTPEEAGHHLGALVEELPLPTATEEPELVRAGVEVVASRAYVHGLQYVKGSIPEGL